MRKDLIKRARQSRRVIRVRKKVRGTPQRPRLSVSRSLKNIFAQIIDDVGGRTLCSASTQQDELRQAGYGGNCKAAAEVGKLLATRAKEAGIQEVCFDRRGRRYHGRIKALADAAREAGLKF